MTLRTLIFIDLLLASPAAYAQSYTAPAGVPAELTPGGVSGSVGEFDRPDFVTGSIQTRDDGRFDATGPHRPHEGRRTAR